MILSRTNLFTVAFAAIVSLSSCIGNGPITIDEAENNFSDGHYDAAASICDNLISRAKLDDLSVNELCRLSMLTAKLSEHDNEETNMALATRCMQVALQKNPDSVLMFVHSLQPDEQPRTLFIRQLTRSLDPSCDPNKNSEYNTDSIADS